MGSKGFALLALATALGVGLVVNGMTSGEGGAAAAQPVKQAAGAAYARLPLRFEPNRGQTHGSVRFLTRGSGYTLFLTDREAVFALAGRGRGGAARQSVVRMRLAGGRGVAPVAGRRLPGVTNHLSGRAGARGATGVPGYASVRYRSALPGIDLEYHARRKGLEYDFIVAPGAHARAIALELDGARRLRIDRAGRLRIATAAGELRQERPVAHQTIDGRRRPVAVAYRLLSRDRVGLKIGAYDRSHTLVIDPVVSYGTLLGAAGTDSIAGVAVDGSGAAYVTGSTTSTNFPTAGAAQAGNAGTTDAFVAKLNASGTALVYATYIGGSSDDRATDVAVDSAGRAYISGSTSSPQFPVTAGSAQTTFGGGPATGTPPTQPRDAFIAKLDSAGASLLYATYLGGTGVDSANGIDVDSSGAAYVAGTTAPTAGTAAAPSVTNNFPTTAGALQTAFGGGAAPTAPSDAFAARISESGSAVDYSTFLGGTGADSANSIAVDAAGMAYIAGATASVSFPTTPGVVQPALAGGANSDGFVTKLNATGASLAYSTYLGGPGAGGAGPAPTAHDSAAGIAVVDGHAYVTGQTSSGAFPTTPGALQASLAGEGDAFVTKLSPDASSRIYSTYLGGGSSDEGNAIAVHGGNAYVGGSTSSGDFPVENAVSLRAGNGDAFLSKLSATGTSLVHSSIFGGSVSDNGAAVAADSAGNAYLGGQSNLFANGELPTAGGFQPSFGGIGGNTDGFLVKVGDGDLAAPLVTRLLPRSGDTSGGATITIRGTGFGGATQVTFGATPATSFAVVSPTRIDATVPPGATGNVHVRVTTPGRLSPANPAAVFAYAEGDWELAGEMRQARFAGTMTLLANGKVLAAGGRASQNGAALATAELYDPLTRTWSPTGSMSEARFTHTATLLPNGKVLVAGGFGVGLTTNAQPNLRTAELYDPATGTWSDAAPMAVRHALHAAILLRGGACDGAAPPSYCGKVLVASGRTCDPQDAPPAAGCNSNFTTTVAELYDPSDGPAGSWTTVAPLTAPRTTTDAALLPDGRVLVPAGFPGGQNTAEVYDPASNTWTSTDLLQTGRARGGAISLLDGRVLVVAGFPNNQTAEVLDPATLTWTTTSQMLGFGRFNQLQTLLPNGKVLVAGGGNGGATTELYDPQADAWQSAGLLTAGRGSSSSNANSQTAVVLSSSTTSFARDRAVCGADCGKVLLAGETDDRLTELYAQPGLRAGPPAAPAAPAAPAQTPPPPAGPAAPAPPPAPAATAQTPARPAAPAAPAASLLTAKLSLARATIARRARLLDVLAPITRRASGRVRVELRSAGRRTRFTAPISSRQRRIRFRKRISRAQARLATGILTIAYGGDADTRPQTVRLRAAPRRANLRLARPTISADGRLRAAGTVTRSARGVVRVQIEYVSGGTTTTLQFLARIRNGRWSLDERLSGDVRSAIARRTGTVHSYTLFTGYHPRRVRGEMRSFQVLGPR